MTPQRTGGTGFSFVAEVIKVQTMVDNSIRVTLDLPEDAIDSSAMLMIYKRDGIAAKVTVEPA